MSDSLEKQVGQNSSDVSDGEKQTVNRDLNARLKAVPKRRTVLTLTNGDPSTSAAGDGVELQTDDAESDNFRQISSKSAAGRLWTDTVLIQSLEDKMGSSAWPGTTNEKLINRGTETYPLMKAGKKRKRNDDIAIEMMEEEEEKFGWYQASGTKDAKTGILGDDGMKVEGEDADGVKALSVAVDSSVSLWEDVDTGAAELPTEQGHSRRGKWKRFKQNNRHYQKQSHPWKKPFKKGQKMFKNEAKTEEGQGEQKMQKQWKMVPPEKFVPHKLLTPNYATEKLMKMEFNVDEMSEEQLTQGLTEALGETIPELMQKVVHFAGKSHAVELFKQCQEVERNGGMLTQNRNRRRTPGGVFMKLFNDSKQINEEQKKTMHEFSTEKQLQSGRYPKWWEKMRQRKEKKAEEAKQKEEATQRELILTLLHLWSIRSIKELDMIEEELKMVALYEKRNSHPSILGDSASTSNDFKHAEPVRLKPFIIARSEAQKRVFGLGYPSVPTKTVDEWYDEMQKSGTFGKGAMPSTFTINQRETEKDEEVKEEEEERERQAQIQRDEWKDMNRRGCGNTYNKG